MKRTFFGLTMILATLIQAPLHAGDFLSNIDPTNPNGMLRQRAANTPVDPTTWRFPTPPRSGGSEQTWGGESTTNYEIRQDGWVYTREVYNNGRSINWTRTNTRAQCNYDASGRFASWFYPQAKNSPLRAPQFDRQVPVPTPPNGQTGSQQQGFATSGFGNQMGQPVVEFRYRIDPPTGQVFCGQFTNGNFTGEGPTGIQAARFYNLAHGLWHWTAKRCDMVLMP